jgi:hypothetical protein
MGVRLPCPRDKNWLYFDTKPLERPIDPAIGAKVFGRTDSGNSSRRSERVLPIFIDRGAPFRETLSRPNIADFSL